MVQSPQRPKRSWLAKASVVEAARRDAGVPADRNKARPAGFEPATFGSGGRSGHRLNSTLSNSLILKDLLNSIERHSSVRLAQLRNHLHSFRRSWLSRLGVYGRDGYSTMRWRRLTSIMSAASATVQASVTRARPADARPGHSAGRRHCAITGVDGLAARRACRPCALITRPL